jgi:hypothetical protein
MRPAGRLPFGRQVAADRDVKGSEAVPDAEVLVSRRGHGAGAVGDDGDQ